MMAIDFFKQLQARELLIIVEDAVLEKSIQQLGFKNTALVTEFDFVNNSKAVLWLISEYEHSMKWLHYGLLRVAL